jgi:signal peptide peptidase SppA
MKYSHLATRLFGTPLLMERGKLETIVSVFGQRAGVEITVNGAVPAIEPPKVRGYDSWDEEPLDRQPTRPYGLTSGGIAVVNVMGPLVKRASGDFMSGGPTTYGEVEHAFVSAVNDAGVKGILLCVDSPGGETVGCFELSDMIYANRGKKPIVAAADGDAFSAAYAIASAADEVYVTKSGGVGSVGVWMAHVDQSAFDKDLGVKVTYIFAGARKIDGNPHEPLGEEAYAVFKAEVDRVYDMFVATVARNRGMGSKAVRATEAGLYFGSNGVAVGFADKVGVVSDALSALTKQVKSSSKVAVSATNPTKREGNMPQEEKTGTEKTPVEANAEAVAKATAEGFAAGFAHAVKIVGLCAVAGFKCAGAQKFLKADATIESVQKELVEAQAADAGPEINSHVMPDAGTRATDKSADVLMAVVQERSK